MIFCRKILYKILFNQYLLLSGALKITCHCLPDFCFLLLMVSRWKLNWILLGLFWYICETTVRGTLWCQSKEIQCLSGVELWEVKVIILNAEITRTVLFSYWNTTSVVPTVIRDPTLVFKPHSLVLYWLYVVYSLSPIQLSIYKPIVSINICNFTFQVLSD